VLPRPSAEDVAFFEARVRPVLATNCASCHSGSMPASGLRLDVPALVGKGGARGLAVVPGKPDASLLVRAVRYADPNLRMPPAGKLPAEQIAALEEWVRRGAPVPASTALPPPVSDARPFSLAARRKHWAYQPVRRVPVPPVRDRGWVRNPVDAFVLAKLEAAGLRPAPPADRRTLLRRVTFDLTGLPPTPAEIDAFLADRSPNAYEKVVDRLLASPTYGERWARHWLDLVRYSETLGHEFDYDIPNAYQYRDYVIRALNRDVPYDQFLREHIAGDLLPVPRRDPRTGWNESIQGTGFWWLGEGKHSPVDVKQEQADRIDNQIDVFGKAFLAQTLSCARCHDHKFDPIPARDYYGLYGVLASSRYQQATLEPLSAFAESVRRCDAVRTTLPRRAIADAWQASLTSLPEVDLRAAMPAGAGAGRPPGYPLPPLDRWRSSGEAFSRVAQPGDLVLAGDPDRPALALIARPTAHSALRSRRLEGALRSPTFVIDRSFLHLKLSGVRGRLHVVVENFTLIRDPIYGALAQTIDTPEPTWRTIDVHLWEGRRAYVELSDGPLANLTQDPLSPPDEPSDAWLRLDGARLSDSSLPPTRTSSLAGKPMAEVRAALLGTLSRWAQDTLSAGDTDALDVLDRLLRAGVLDTRPLASAARALVAIDAGVPVPVRAPAMCDGNGEDEHVFLRGSYRTPGEIAPRLRPAFCFREASPAAPVAGSGRLELSQWIANPSHPLTARVLVNRLWEHHFGRGIVATPDDFGHMGERPTHPELLDWLAGQFVRPAKEGGAGWSLKAMHRLIVLSATYRMSSSAAAAGPSVERRDPANALLHRMPVTRLEAEAIRDAILAVSGRLDRTLYGPPVSVYLTEFTEGRGRPEQGPLDGGGRRSIYQAVRRNFLSPWMLAFDFPTPASTMGRRSVSNVPAQALAMMNGPFVREQAGVWASHLLAETTGATVGRRVALLYESAYGRPPSADEVEAARAFLGGRDDHASWSDLCHVLLNVKEFLFVR
jgi:hypothetical protein